MRTTPFVPSAVVRVVCTVTPALLLVGAVQAQSWSLSGNAGTTPGTNFLGTTDNKALELKVSNQRGLRLEPHGTDFGPNVIGGWRLNAVTAGARAATIAGGGAVAFDIDRPNRV